MTDALDYYLETAPSEQSTLDIFKGEWLSKLPHPYGLLEAGGVPLFNDNRTIWAIEKLGGVDGQTIVELGPLEGGHTYLFEKFGAAKIVAIEANARAYLKCLMIKEMLGLTRSSFLFGNCVEYLKTQTEMFDLCSASGILYHMTNPAELLALIAGCSDRLYLWTHYYDPEIIPATPHLARKFGGAIDADYNGFQHTLYRHTYEYSTTDTFIGGDHPYSHWMTREGLLQALDYFGFGDIEINFEIPNHPSGSCFSLIAVKTQPRGSTASTDPSSEALSSSIPSMSTLKTELQHAKDRIAAMETSKFWKLRTQWFKVKRWVGLGEEE
jgi:Protein of unknown function (DUF1698)